MNDLFKDIVNNVVHGTVNSTRDQATWEGASVVERATFGKVFNFIEGILGLVMIFGCVLISNAMSNSQFLMYLVGIIWVIPFVAIMGLLARFRQSLFVRIRGIMNSFLGGNR